jgi:hypothetical protein
MLIGLLAASATTARAQCLGDCDGSGGVSTSEVVLGVEIAVLAEPPSACAAYGGIPEVDDLVTAVNNDTCPAPTGTPTATPTVTPTATVTNTPGAAPIAVAGGAAVVAKSLSAIPSLVSAIVTGLVSGTPPEEGQGGAAGMCPLGGEATRVCSAITGAAHLDIALASCGVATPDGSLVLNTFTPLTLDFLGANCSNLIALTIQATANVRGRYLDSQATPLLDTSAILAASVMPITTFPQPACRITGATLDVTGLLSSTIPNGGGSAVINFMQTTVNLTNIVFNASCLPVQYNLTFNGPAEVRDVSTGEFAHVVFNNLLVRVNSTAVPTTLEIEGGVQFDCIQGNILLDTVAPLLANPGSLCPTGGEIDISSIEGMSKVVYMASGQVDVDVDDDGDVDHTFSSCSDPNLQLCPEPAP